MLLSIEQLSELPGTSTKDSNSATQLTGDPDKGFLSGCLLNRG